MWRAVKFIASLLGCLLIAALMVFVVFLVTVAPVIAATPPGPGKSCTYTPPTEAEASPSRTYEVEVLGIFEAASVRGGQRWFWVKRPGQDRYASVIVPDGQLSGCR